MAREKPDPEPVLTCPGCGHRTGGGPFHFCPGCGADLAAARQGTTGAFLRKVIADRYRIIARIGEGGMGAVYKAEHIRMGKVLALKVLRADVARDEAAVERFRVEAQIVSRLSHPHTIAVFDFGEIGNGSGFYLAMEYVPGKDLAALLRETGRLPEPRVARIGAQILGSLAEAHDAGIVHRDIKPGNVMLVPTRSGEDFAKVLDFGIAKLRDDGNADAAEASGAGAIVGTPNYLAPEQARGGAVDGRSDLYATGCLLYELAAGRPPFQASSLAAIVAAHLHETPPPLADVPGISRRFAEVIHRALSKKPQDRHGSADEMGAALLALAEPGGRRRTGEPAPVRATGGLELASRQDFRDLDRQVRALRRSRTLGPLTALAVALAVAAGIWRWPALYALVAARAPAVAALVPGSLRPGSSWDGSEHEPNDVPASANPLPIPTGAGGRPGVAVVHGTIGARLSDTVGDVDIFRIEVPPGTGRKVLVAEWHGEKEGEGIRGLAVGLALNRLRPDGDGATAPLVAAVNRGGPGKPERLAVAVEPGTYYLSVRERHDEAAGPVEKPTDRYVLEVRLADPRPGEEVEPNDAPDRMRGRFERYPEWRALARRNPMGEGTVIHGETAPDDPDVYGIEPRGPGEAPALVAAVPAGGLALTARVWLPDAEDLGPAKPEDRVRFEPAGEEAAGAVLLVRLPAPPREGAPAILELRAAAGDGRYDVLALGAGAASSDALLATVRALAAAGRPAPALELAAAQASRLAPGPGRAEVLLAAGRIAEALAPGLAPPAARAHQRAGALLGTAIFEEAGEKVVYRGAFEALVQGEGRAADEAALRLAVLAPPCTPDAVVARAAAFLGRKPTPAADLAAEARLLRARALEDAYWSTGGKDRARLDTARAAWKGLTSADGTGEPALRAAALGAQTPSREGARPACR